MIDELSALIILCAIPAGLGAIMDRLLRKKDKSNLHLYLLGWWMKLDETEIRSMHHAFAEKTITMAKRVYGDRFWSRRALALICITSFCLTICVFVVATYFDEDTNFEELTLSVWSVVLPVNLVFDVITAIATFHILDRITQTNALYAIPLIMIDMSIAICCAMGCIALIVVAFGEYSHDTVIGVFEYLLPWLNLDLDLNFTGFMYSATTLIPTIAYMTVLLALVIGKLAISMVIPFSKFFFERATEVGDSKDLIVFTLTGSLFSALSLILSALVKLYKL